MPRTPRPGRPALLLAAALCATLTASLVSAGATRAGDCHHCRDRGLLPCPSHPKDGAEAEYAAEYCSEIADCEECGGAGWLDCPRCENPEARAWLEAKLGSVREARDELGWIAKGMERPVPVARSRHFAIAWDPKKLAGTRRVKGAHELMHLYLSRLEELMSAYADALRLEPDREFERRLTVLVWANEEDQLRASRTFCDFESAYPAKQLGRTPRLSLSAAKPQVKGDEELYRIVVHELGHLLPSAQRPAGWVGDKHGGWLDAGFAHWFEERTLGACEEVCFNARYYKDQVRPTRWRDHARDLVSGDDLPDLETVLIQDTETLTFEFHVLSFSLVEFLVERDPQRFDVLMQRMRARTPVRDALQEAFDLSLEDLESEWTSWVRSGH